MITLSSIGQQIRLARKSAGLTAVALSKTCSINRNTLNKLESGQGNVELNTLLAICAKLHLTLQLVPDEVALMPNPAQTAISPLREMLQNRLGGKSAPQGEQ